jgi:hypothetical protein
MLRCSVTLVAVNVPTQNVAFVLHILDIPGQSTEGELIYLGIEVLTAITTKGCNFLRGSAV